MQTERTKDGGKIMESKKRLIPMHLGNCEETDCEYFSWCGDSYEASNTECYCRLNGKSVFRCYAEEDHIPCPMGKMMEDESDDECHE